MTANKYNGVRAALVQDAETAALTRQHNNSNILCLPGRSLENEPEILKNILKNWLETPFEGGAMTSSKNLCPNLISLINN